MGKNLPFVVGLGLIGVLATGAGVYILTGGEDARTVLAVLCFSFAAALLIGALAFYLVQQAARVEQGRLVETIRNDLISFDKRIHQDANRFDELENQMTEVHSAAQQSHEAMAQGLHELRESYTSMSGQLREAVSAISTSLAQQAQAPQHYGYPAYQPQHEFAPANDIPPAPPAPIAMPYGEQAVYAEPEYEEEVELRASFAEDESELQQHVQPEPEPSPIILAAPQPVPRPTVRVPPTVRIPKPDELITSLEPVIDLFTNKTAHYRLHLSMQKPDGTEVPTDTLLHHADRAGLRNHFDVHAAREALGLLRHLRERDGQINIFMPLGASTLATQDTVEKLLALRAEFPDVGSGLIFELPHATLAGLSERGLEGLATLARSGVFLALTNVAMAGVDVASLAKLNVRYLSLNTTTALGATGPTPQVISFAQTARANRILLIVTNITNANLAKQVSKIGRFVAGPAFAPPRRVKQGVALESVRPTRNAA
jgi:EAL domain-containing protein (putative c-di-GMP-specific phosphodiesterase class I)